MKYIDPYQKSIHLFSFLFHFILAGFPIILFYFISIHFRQHCNESQIIEKLGGISNVLYLCLTNEKAHQYIDENNLIALTQLIDQYDNNNNNNDDIITVNDENNNDNDSKNSNNIDYQLPEVHTFG